MGYLAIEQKAAWTSELERTLGRVNEYLARTGNETIVPLVPILPTLVDRQALDGFERRQINHR